MVNRVERLKKFQELWNKPTYHDVILGVFAFSGLDCFTTDVHRLHPFFYKWREEKVLPLLDQLYFSHRPPGGPLSDQIYTAITLMFMGRLVYTLVPPSSAGDVFSWQKGARDRIKKDCEVRFTKEDLEVVKKIAEDFKIQFKTECEYR